MQKAYRPKFGAGEPLNHRLSGVKEEILLSRNVGKNSFDFLVETGGLILTETNGQFTLVDPRVWSSIWCYRSLWR
jgi:hypothetical protein